MTLGVVSHLNNSFPIASGGARRPETFSKTAIYCHLLPFRRRKTVASVAFVAYSSADADPRRPRAENCEQSHEDPSDDATEG